MKRRSDSITQKNYRINHQISATKIRLIDEDGKQIGIVDISEALTKAQNNNLDIVEIAPNANPPVVKITDFKKFKFLQEKKEKEARKHLKEVEVKEIRMGPFVSEHDLNTRLVRAEGFLTKGNRIKITIKFTGRQMIHPEFGYKLLDRIHQHFKDKVKVEREPKFAGRQLSSILSPIGKI